MIVVQTRRLSNISVNPNYVLFSKVFLYMVALEKYAVKLCDNAKSILKNVCCFRKGKRPEENEQKNPM